MKEAQPETMRMISTAQANTENTESMRTDVLAQQTCHGSAALWPVMVGESKAHGPHCSEPANNTIAAMLRAEDVVSYGQRARGRRSKSGLIEQATATVVVRSTEHYLRNG